MTCGDCGVEIDVYDEGYCVTCRVERKFLSERL